MNNDMVEDQNGGGCPLKDSEPFRRQYAMVLVQLKEASGQACGFHELYFALHFCTSVPFSAFSLKQIFIECRCVQVSSALLHLRQRNTYPADTLPPWLKPPANSSVHGGLTSCLDNSSISQESGSNVDEIVKGSRLKAHTMVDAAIQV